MEKNVFMQCGRMTVKNAKQLVIYTAVALLLLASETATAAEGTFTITPTNNQQQALPNSKQVFSDVSPSHWAYDTLQWGYANGIIKGFEDNTIRSDAFVTEEQFLSMLLRSMGVSAIESGTNWSQPYYDFAASTLYQGIILQQSTVHSLPN